MLAVSDNMVILAVIAVAVAVLLGVAAFVGTFLGRQMTDKRAGGPSQPPPTPPLNEELHECVELGDSVARDVEIVSSLLAEESPTIPPELMKAMQQLLRTTKQLSGKLQNVNQVQPGAPATAAAQTRTSAEPIPEKPALSQKSATALAPPQPASEAHDETDDQEDGAESRRFPRSPCHGSLQATIYPPPHIPGGDPIRCCVLTRNLSCGGVGIAHSEKLFPKQVLVLEAVGRLLVAEVRWCRQLDEKFFIVGCRLIKTGE